MKKKLFVLFLVVCLALAGCTQPTPAQEAPAPEPEAAEPAAAALDKDLVILYTNDVHCAVKGGDDENCIGYDGVAALKQKYLDDGNYVALVDCGDAVQGDSIGTLSTGSYLVDIMNELGYDAAIPGNHEFDYGMDRFFELVDAANYPYLSCNFTDLAAGQPALSPYTIKEYNGVKVAFVGVSTPRTITSSTPAYFQDENGEFVYGFCQGDGSELYSAVQSGVDAARAEGAQYVIALTHLGITYDCSPYTSTEVIENTTGIDVVLDGHSHTVLPSERMKNMDGEWVTLSSTGTQLANVGMLLITKDGNISTGLIGAADSDPAMSAYVDGIIAEFDALLNEVVASTAVDLTINEPGTDIRIIRNAETNLGDLCADAYRAASGADIAIVNGGGIRANIPAGDITYGNIISVHPYGNMLCMVEATGQEILDALEMGCRMTPEESGGFLQVSGITYEIDVNIPTPVVLDDNGMFTSVEGERRVKNVLVAGEPIDPAKTYTVASHNYLIKDSGDGYTMFADNVILLDEIMIDNQVLINYIVDVLGGVVGEDYSNPYGQERIIAAK